jgi:glyoxylase-like metal-dependent hydrolase (beta-lactamase superfamily II)
MYESLTQRLAVVPDDTVLYPGHLYSVEPSATMGETRAHNYVFRIPTLDQWRMFMGA